jgi:hypothetical protein
MAVKTFRHTVALDEHRAKFKPVYWHAPNQGRPKIAKIPTEEFAMTIFERMFAENFKNKKGEGKGKHSEH